MLKHAKSFFTSHINCFVYNSNEAAMFWWNLPSRPCVHWRLLQTMWLDSLLTNRIQVQDFLPRSLASHGQWGINPLQFVDFRSHFWIDLRGTKVMLYNEESMWTKKNAIIWPELRLPYLHIISNWFALHDFREKSTRLIASTSFVALCSPYHVAILDQVKWNRPFKS